MGLIYSLGKWGFFALDSLLGIGRGRNFFLKCVEQMYRIGARSLLLILLISLFTGLVLGLQAYYAMSMFGAEAMLGSLLSLSLVRELAPVLTAIMLAGRAGSAMTAEIGHMRLSEQIDALQVMGINPMLYLVSPRIMASLVVFPLLTAIFNVMGLLGGYLSACVLLDLSYGTYFSAVESSVKLYDIMICFIKAIFFGFFVSLVSCYKGFYVHALGQKGAQALGLAITDAMVLSSIVVLVADYVLTVFLLI